MNKAKQYQQQIKNKITGNCPACGSPRKPVAAWEQYQDLKKEIATKEISKNWR